MKKIMKSLLIAFIATIITALFMLSIYSPFNGQIILSYTTALSSVFMLIFTIWYSIDQ